MKNNFFSLGVMSGTSMDGIDCCLANITLTDSYDFQYKIIKEKYIPFSNIDIDRIKRAINNTTSFNKDLDDHLGILFSDIISKYFKDNKIDIISIHGQTISHKDREYSIQVGSPKYIYDRFRVPVIHNFRKQDIDAGGNGAPLIPFLDWLLFKDIDCDTITLNIGGIANISYVTQHCLIEDVIGFDTGPGMSLIDECAKIFWNANMDSNCKYSIQGKINNELLHSLMDHKYLHLDFPKSTGRWEFGKKFIEQIIHTNKEVSNIDILRTLVYFSAKTISDSINNLVDGKKYDFFINGGGKHHELLIQDILSLITNYNHRELTELNINSDFKEALLMSVLGVANILNIKSNIKSVTGAKFDIVCGDKYGK